MYLAHLYIYLYVYRFSSLLTAQPLYRTLRKVVYEVDDKARTDEHPVESHDGVTLSNGREFGSEAYPENVVLHVVRALSDGQKQSPARNKVLRRDEKVA